MRLDIVKILGVNKAIADVKINGNTYTKFLYNIQDEVCHLVLQFKKNNPFIPIDFACLWSRPGYVSSICSNN